MQTKMTLIRFSNSSHFTMLIRHIPLCATATAAEHRHIKINWIATISSLFAYYPLATSRPFVKYKIHFRLCDAHKPFLTTPSHFMPCAKQTKWISIKNSQFSINSIDMCVFSHHYCYTLLLLLPVNVKWMPRAWDTS